MGDPFEVSTIRRDVSLSIKRERDVILCLSPLKRSQTISGSPLLTVRIKEIKKSSLGNSKKQV